MIDEPPFHTARPDRTQLPRLNALWAIVDRSVDVPSSVRARIASGARRLLGRVLSRQQEFNAAVVEHLNRNQPVLDELQRATERIYDVSDALDRQREALLARERRSDAAVTALTGSHGELRAAVNVLQQATQQLKRELTQVHLPAEQLISAHTASVDSAAPSSAGPPSVASQFASADSYKYVGFEHEFRGSAADVASRLVDYAAIFENVSDVLDIGCGRGEFLEVLRARGITARGIDLNPSMVDVCVEKGLSAAADDALTHLRSLPDGSLGGLFAAQVVEHLEPRYLTALLDIAYDKLRPGAPIVLETINPACWLAFFESYIRDITHVRPIHPDTLKYLLIASGFQYVEVQFRSPYPESEKLQPVAGAALGTDSAAVRDFVETLNANVAKLNGLMFTSMDFAAVGRRGSSS